ERLGGAYVGTIHGFCRQLLRTFGYGALVARLSDVDYSRGLLHEATEEVLEGIVLPAGPHPLRQTLGRSWRIHDLRKLVQEIYDGLRNRAFDPALVALATQKQAPDEGHAFRMALAGVVAQVHEVYSRKKQAENKLDATDLLVETARLLEGADGLAIARNLGKRSRYLFIDEFQDTDALQKRILDRLAPHL